MKRAIKTFVLFGLLLSCKHESVQPTHKGSIAIKNNDTYSLNDVGISRICKDIHLMKIDFTGKSYLKELSIVFSKTDELKYMRIATLKNDRYETNPLNPTEHIKIEDYSFDDSQKTISVTMSGRLYNTNTPYGPTTSDYIDFKLTVEKAPLDAESC